MDRAIRLSRARATVALAVSLLALVGACKRPAEVRITSPVHGTFFPQTTTSIAVDGEILRIDPADVQVTVNGVAAQVDVAAKSFRAFVPVVAGEVFQPLVAEMTQLGTDKVFRHRVVAITGPMRPDALPIVDGFGLRLLQSGLDDVAPIAAALIEQQLDLAALLPSSFDSDGATITILTNPAPSFGGLTLAFDAKAGRLDVTGVLDDVSVDLKIDKSGIFGGVHCSMQVDVQPLSVTTHQQLAPTSDGSSIAVRQVAVGGSEVGVAFSGLASVVDCENSGLFEKKKEQKVRDKLQASLATALADFLTDPDGPGPNDAPIAAAVEGQLAALDIGGIVVPALSSEIDARFASVDELALGLEAFLDVDVNPLRLLCDTPLGGPVALPALPDPDLPGSLLVPSGAPVLDSIVLHDAAFAVSLSAINRLLMSETEARSFELVIDEVDGVPLSPATFAAIQGDRRAAAGDADPRRGEADARARRHGERGSARRDPRAAGRAPAGVAREARRRGGTTKEEELLRVAIDARLGVSVIQDANGALSASLGTLDTQSLRFFVVANPIGTDANLLEALGPIVLARKIPQLISTTISFPLPSFFDLDLRAVAVRRQPGHMVVFTRLDPAA